MLNKNEIISISIITLILAFTISLIQTTQAFLQMLLIVFLVLIVNITAKKITSFYLDSEIEIKMWEILRYGFQAHKQFKNPFPAGVFVPLILIAITLGKLKWMASLVFEVKAKTYRAAKRYGVYSFSEMTEYHIALIAASGIIANLIFAIIGYLIGFPDFSRINIYYAFFNLFPISDLDGNKIFFGSLILWSFITSITLIALGFAILLV
ncbi:MAG TPA: hypothetical protein VJB35_00260 [Candidatus Nanoarchaeia archaeon]|nr:hypothetical protein [Candidatus Nanoarchaeia archaeon]